MKSHFSIWVQSFLLKGPLAGRYLRGLPGRHGRCPGYPSGYPSGYVSGDVPCCAPNSYGFVWYSSSRYLQFRLFLYLKILKWWRHWFNDDVVLKIVISTGKVFNWPVWFAMRCLGSTTVYKQCWNSCSQGLHWMKAMVSTGIMTNVESRELTAVENGPSTSTVLATSGDPSDWWAKSSLCGEKSTRNPWYLSSLMIPHREVVPTVGSYDWLATSETSTSGVMSTTTRRLRGQGKKNDAKGLLFLRRVPEGYHWSSGAMRFFNNFKSAECDRMIGDRKLRNWREGRIPGVSTNIKNRDSTLNST